MVTVQLGKTFKFECLYVNQDPINELKLANIKYSWFKDGQQIESKADDSPEFIIEKASVSDAGSYTCNIKNDALDINSKPGLLVLNDNSDKIETSSMPEESVESTTTALPVEETTVSYMTDATSEATLEETSTVTNKNDLSTAAESSTSQFITYDSENEITTQYSEEPTTTTKKITTTTTMQTPSKTTTTKKSTTKRPDLPKLSIDVSFTEREKTLVVAHGQTLRLTCNAVPSMPVPLSVMIYKNNVSINFRVYFFVWSIFKMNKLHFRNTSIIPQGAR
jgi:hypothetical protein